MSEDMALLISAIGTIGTAIATLGLWLVAWRTLGGARDQLQLLQEQAKAEARPYVVLEVVPGLHPPPAMDLVVRNTGRSMARNVVLQTEHWDPREESDYITERLQAFMRKPRLLAPGSRVRVMWSSEDEESAAGAPATQSVTAVYNDDRGVEYRDRYDFVVDELVAAAPVPSTGPRATSGGDKAMRNIDHAIRRLSAHVAELRR